jgi:hypothetical protein
MHRHRKRPWVMCCINTAQYIIPFTYISHSELFPTKSVRQKQHVDAVGCRKLLVGQSACSIFSKLLAGLSRFVVGTLHPLAIPLAKDPQARDVRLYLSYFPAHKTHFFPPKNVTYIRLASYAPRVSIISKLINTRTAIIHIYHEIVKFASKS